MNAIAKATGRLQGAIIERCFWLLLPFLSLAMRMRLTSRSRRIRRDWKLIDESGIMDSQWYCARYRITTHGKRGALLHYLCVGARKRYSPNPLFDVQWYLQKYPDVASSGLNPLIHYIKHGVSEGRNPSPAFDSRWYLKQNQDVAKLGKNPLAHFLASGAAEGRNPNPLFDVSWYLRQYPDVAEAGTNPLVHYLENGWHERREPHPCFNTRKYLLDNPDVAVTGVQPLLDCLQNPVRMRELLALYRRNRRKAGTTLCSHEPEAADGWPEPDVGLIAFYLPQFHRIPQNDKWWGEGFTEWTNVRAGRPNHEGHYQPQVPHPHVGYYDLTDETVLQRQVELARKFGVRGFCFYHYWFGGERLLEMPIDRFLQSGTPDFPFCLCWANENWTRRWDGMEHEILMAQKHSPELDEQFIRDVLPAMRDRRYIRLNGRPLFLIYRPLLLPDPAATFRRWREVCRAEGLGEVFLAGVQGFGFVDPAPLGLDAAVEFPPNVEKARPLFQEETDAFPHFCGEIYDYHEIAHDMQSRPAPNYRLFRGVMPSWDNTARRKERGTIFIDSSPEEYCRWLGRVVSDTRLKHEPDERIVFINAWNEWAEGCHLEPDDQYGYAWLNATRRALLPSPALFPAPVLIVAHDAARAGAQILLLTLLREWKRTRPFPFCLILNGDGVLRDEFAACCPTLVLADHPEIEKRRTALGQFLTTRPRIIYSNTVVNGPLLKELRWLDVPVITHVHELQKSIERWASGPIMEDTLLCSKRFIAVSPLVADNLQTRHRVAPEAITLVHGFVDVQNRTPDAAALSNIREGLGADQQDILVIGCGTTDWRKGPDLFVEIAAQCRAEPRLRFAWIGPGSPAELEALENAIQKHGLAEHVRFIGPHPNPRELIPAGQIFLLPSREDPFPLVALEAAEAGLPVVCFAGAGGMPDFVGQEECGIVVPFSDTAAAAAAVQRLALDEPLRTRLGKQAREKVRRKHSTPPTAARIAKLVDETARCETTAEPPSDGRPLVSVIVPNFNHAPLLTRRLESIVAQGIADMEIILLDDASTDGSLPILDAFAATHPRARLVVNDVNSGSTFKQWRKGLGLARGRFVWIAESDDSAEPGLLAVLLHKLRRNPGAAFAYVQSRMVDETDRDLGLPLEWTADLSQTRWLTDFKSTGNEEIRDALSIKNSIPNASAVVFRNFEDIADLVDDTMRLCADWLFWVRLCRRGGVAFDARPLNRWRQRTSNARTRPPGELEWLEGSIVMEECAAALGASDAERAELLSAFRARCEGWLAAEAVTA